jgi:LacI family transcriptional regulator
VKDAHVTLHDVAARAGVSVATASRALSGIGVRQTNRTRVTSAAEELGYVPNEAARALRNVRTMTVGVVFNKLTGPLGTELLDALVSGLDQHGYSLFVATAQGSKERYDELVHRFLERRVDALLCVNAIGDGAALARFMAAGVPVAALFSKSDGYEKLPLIAPSISDAVADCIDRLKALGHSHLGILRPNPRFRRVEVFRRWASESGIRLRDYEYDEEIFDAGGFVARLASDTGRPTVIVAAEAEAIAIFEAAQQVSLGVPKLLSIVAIRDHELRMPMTKLPISVLHLSPSKVGVTAVEILVRVLSQEDSTSALSPATVQMGSWIERASTGPAPLTNSAD